MIRELSQSEVSTALDCFARWDFGYGGHLAGDALAPKAVAPILSEGRAWGAAVAAWHSLAGAFPEHAMDEAHAALAKSLAADAIRQEDFGLYDVNAHREMAERLEAMLDHYTATVEPFKIERLEHELVVPLPSRTRKRASSLYRFLCRIDGWHVDEQGYTWIVEFKLRGQLQPVWLMELSRQLKWYSWAFHQWASDLPAPVGVIVDERLNEVPKPPRIVQAKRKDEGIDGKVPSHAKDQLCTQDDYVTVCEEYGVGVHPETFEALNQRRWQQRQPIEFRQGELEEAGEELVTAAKLIRNLDSGDFYPLRNAKKQVCNGCRFKDICPNPQDAFLVNAQFERVPAKRDRPKEEGAHAARQAEPARVAA